MRKVYVVDLSKEEKAQLRSLSKKGETSAGKPDSARVAFGCRTPNGNDGIVC